METSCAISVSVWETSTWQLYFFQHTLHTPVSVAVTIKSSTCAIVKLQLHLSSTFPESGVKCASEVDDHRVRFRMFIGSFHRVSLLSILLLLLLILLFIFIISNLKLVAVVIVFWIHLFLFSFLPQTAETVISIEGLLKDDQGRCDIYNYSWSPLNIQTWLSWVFETLQWVSLLKFPKLHPSLTAFL